MKLNNYDKAMVCACISIVSSVFAFLWDWVAISIQAIAFIGLIYYSRKIRNC